MAKTTVELPPALHRTLRVKAALDNCSMNDIVVAALQGYLDSFRLEPEMLEVETVQRGRGSHHGDVDTEEDINVRGKNRSHG